MLKRSLVQLLLCIGVPLVVHYWAGLQSVHGLRSYDNIAANAKCQRVLCTRFVSGFMDKTEYDKFCTIYY